MKRVQKRLISIFSTVLALSLILSACNGGDEGTEGQTDDPAGGNDTTDADPNGEEPGGLRENTMPITTEDITLSIFIGFAGGARQVYNSMAEMDLVKEMMEETGITLEFVHAPEADDGTFFTTMIGSNNYPDIMSNSFSSYPGGPTAAMDDGVLMDVTDLINEHAYYYNQILDGMDPEVRIRSLSDDGRIVRFGTVFLPDYLDGVAHGGFIVRKDLLDNAGITDLPETIDDYENMFDAFLEAGVVPWALSYTEWQNYDYSPVATALGLTARYSHIEDGEVVYSRTSPRFREYLEIMNRWYERGYFTSDALSQSTQEAQTTFQAGNAGAILAGSWEIITLESVGKANEADLEVVGLPHPRVNEGDQITTYVSIIQNPETRTAFISNQTEHPVEAVRFIDYLYKPETMKMTAWGINMDEQTLWTENEDGTRQWTDFMLDNPDFDYEIGRQRYTANALQGMWDEDMERIQYDIPQVQQAWGVWKPNTSNEDLPSLFLSYTTDESRELSELVTALETYGDEMVLSFITGQTSLDEFDTFVAELEAIGSGRVEEIRQAAYERYLAR